MNAEAVIALTTAVDGGSEPATMFLTQDALFVSSKSLLLAFTDPESIMPPELLEWMSSAPSNSLIDFRAVAAEEFDFQMEKFLPPRARQFSDLCVRPAYLAAESASAASKETLEAAHKAAFASSTVDLTELYLQGQGRPLYGRRGTYAQPGDRKLEHGPQARKFRFRFENRVAVVNGFHLDALQQLGVHIYCPTSSPDGTIPPVGLQNESGDILGTMQLLKDSEIVSDGQGRPLFNDAAEVCWETEDGALRILSSSYSHPLDDLPEDIYDVLKRSPTLNQATRYAVGALRWLGWDDDTINAAYISSREGALQEHYERALQLASLWVDKLPDAPSVFYAEGDLKKAARTMELLQKMNPGIELDLGDLPRAVAMLEARRQKGAV